MPVARMLRTTGKLIRMGAMLPLAGLATVMALEKDGDHESEGAHDLDKGCLGGRDATDAVCS